MSLIGWDNIKRELSSETRETKKEDNADSVVLEHAIKDERIKELEIAGNSEQDAIPGNIVSGKEITINDALNHGTYTKLYGDLTEKSDWNKVEGSSAHEPFGVQTIESTENKLEVTDVYPEESPKLGRLDISGNSTQVPDFAVQRDLDKTVTVAGSDLDPNKPSEVPNFTIYGGTIVDSTELTVTHQLGKFLIPFIVGSDGIFHMTVSGTGLSNGTAYEFFWIICDGSGTKYPVYTLDKTNLPEDTIVALIVVLDTLPEDFSLSTDNVPQLLKTDLIDIQGNVRKSLILNSVTSLTGDLSDLGACVTETIDLSGCSLITGKYSDLGNKVSYNVSLDGCENLTGDLSDFSKVYKSLSLNGCVNTTGCLSSLNSDLLYDLDLGGCDKVTGSLSDISDNLSRSLILSGCKNITGSLSDLNGNLSYSIGLTDCKNITGAYKPTSSETVPTYLYLQNTGLSASDVDNTLINLSSKAAKAGFFYGTGLMRTAASDAAITTLTNLGWVVDGLTKI